ncbi:PqiB family protein [Belnapia rosea]|uniref:Paraquat-inducible protein B n=1 Tax=Belnapia rosea TaxID=938405 RepID=A0A1G6TR28_9PROT|nr:MlaD family protein [Belnapia rosea]SDB69025.1 paraquat-inducible protein B [Belnapia rosea]SDD31364.1 paraquat-inducible protein B [Belnapia rosea]
MSGTQEQPAEAERRLRRRRISPIWLVPVVALLIAGYLGWRTYVDRGPLVTVTFRDAGGLTAGQTQVRYKAVQVGTVETIELSDDLQQVQVRLRMNKSVQGRLTEGARFWVVRPRLTAGNVSGLETIVSGAYIEFDPGGEGASERDFAGLENPPGVRSDEPGRVFTLLAQRVGSLDRGSPVFFRDVTVGEILDIDPPGLDGNVTIHAFIRSPFDGYLREGSRFWNISGINARFGGGGLKLELESLRALLAGGVAFDTPPELRDEPPAPDVTRFQLYDDLEAAVSATTKDRLVFLLYFNESVRGIEVGTPVEMRGLRIGSVLERTLEYDLASDTFRVPVRIAIEPDRIAYPSGKAGRTQEDVLTYARRMVGNGLRGRLQTVSYVTGQVVIAFDFVPDAPPAEVVLQGEEIVMPTMSADSVLASVSSVAAQLQSIPFDEIGRNLNDTLASVSGLAGSPELRGAVQGLSGVLDQAQGLLRRADEGLAPLLRRLPGIASNLDQAVGRASSAMASIERGYGAQSEINRQVARVLAQASDAARSVRLLADLLDRHPEALIRGRTDRGNAP